MMKKKRVCVVLLVGAALGLLAAAVYAGLGFWICPIYRLTGLYCPGCGGTRAVFSLMHGELYQALRYNFAVLLLLPVLTALLCRKGIFYLLGKQDDLFLRIPKAPVWGVLIALLLFGVLRNLPVWPFSLLRPTAVG